MMGSIPEFLVKLLEQLDQDQLEQFQRHLMQKLKKADVINEVEKMVEFFGAEEAVKITLNILRKMKQNHLAEQLENKHKGVQNAPVQTSSPPYNRVSVDVNANRGAIANTPVFTQCTFSDQVIFNLINPITVVTHTGDCKDVNAKPIASVNAIDLNVVILKHLHAAEQQKSSETEASEKHTEKRGDPIHTVPIPYHQICENSIHCVLQVQGQGLPGVRYLHVNVFDGSNWKNVSLKMRSTDTIKKVQQTFLKMRPDFVGPVNLAYNGKPLFLHQTLAELQVKPGATFITYQRLFGQ